MVYRDFFNVVVLLTLVLISWVLCSKLVGANEIAQPTVWELSLDGPIGPAHSDYVVRNLVKADQSSVSAVVLRIDTPGGLDTSMRVIIESILASPVPVIGYVAPQGARAASAGTYILYATHIAAMAPATTLGAATPVQITPLPIPGSEGKKPTKTDTPDDVEQSHPTIEDKMISDARAYIRGLAQLRGRNVEWAEEAVTQAASLSSEEALRENVIEWLASDTEELLEIIDGSSITLQGEKVALETRNVRIVSITPDWRTELLAIVTNPTIAYVLLIIGIYGLIFEFWNPGTIGSGVIGGICLLLGMYALQFLPVNYTGLALILFGVACMIAEAFIPSFGIMGVGGLAAFVIGSVMLLDTDIPGFVVSPWVIATLGVTFSSVFFAVFVLLAKARKRPVVSGPEEMMGSIGKVIDWENGQGRVRAHGEVWQATADAPISTGTTVRVLDMEGLVLTVGPQPQSSLQEKSHD